MTHNTGQWIRVEDRLPEDGQAVWCWSEEWNTPEDSDPAPSQYYAPAQSFAEWEAGLPSIEAWHHVTHWMPMQVPAPPEEE